MGIHGIERGGRHWFWAALALASLCVANVQAQSVQEPDGMPVYRQKRSTFFQNPFSNTYQRLWNKSKGTPAPTPAPENSVAHPSNAAYAASDEATVISIDGEPTAPVVSNPMPHPTQRTRAHGRHVVRKPTLSSLLPGNHHPAQNNTPAPAAAPAERVIHVTDVNEGTPAVGTEYEVKPTQEILRSLAPNEEIVSVKERVIGVYRDGKLVPVETASAAPAAPAVPVRRPAPVPAPVRKEIDPWFGDEVGTPSDEEAVIEGEIDALPPQSFDDSLEVPELPTVEATDIEQTQFTSGNGATRRELVIIERVVPAVSVGESVGESAPVKMAGPAPTRVVRKYQSSYR